MKETRLIILLGSHRPLILDNNVTELSSRFAHYFTSLMDQKNFRAI